MRVVSVNVGLPRDIVSEGKTIRTGIWKQPVRGAVRVGPTNLEGDGQADRRVHGGERKAVYAYPSEHYAFWRAQLERAELPWGSFGENLTVEGLDEETLAPGDRLRVASAELAVTEPRFPCYKLALRLGRADIVDRFLASGRSGFYLEVRREGDLAAGDTIVLLGDVASGGGDGRSGRSGRETGRPTVSDLVRLVRGDPLPAELLRRGTEDPALDEGWRRKFRRRLEEVGEPPLSGSGG